MKNEAAFGYEALLRNMKKEKYALRFTATKVPLHTSKNCKAIRECFISTKSMLR